MLHYTRQLLVSIVWDNHNLQYMWVIKYMQVIPKVSSLNILEQ